LQCVGEKFKFQKETARPEPKAFNDMVFTLIVMDVAISHAAAPVIYIYLKRRGWKNDMNFTVENIGMKMTAMSHHEPSTPHISMCSYRNYK
jgi:hypothetical protein